MSTPTTPSNIMTRTKMKEVLLSTPVFLSSTRSGKSPKDTPQNVEKQNPGQRKEVLLSTPISLSSIRSGKSPKDTPQNVEKQNQGQLYATYHNQRLQKTVYCPPKLQKITGEEFMVGYEAVNCVNAYIRDNKLLKKKRNRVYTDETLLDLFGVNQFHFPQLGYMISRIVFLNTEMGPEQEKEHWETLEKRIIDFQTKIKTEYEY